MEPIAIVGMSVTVPGAPDLATFWENLAGGVESIRFYSREEQAALGVPRSRLDDPGFVPAAAALDDPGLLDAGLFGMTPREAELRDPQQRLFLELAHTALEDAGYDPSRYPGDIGVYGGSGPDEYQWRNIRRNPAVYGSAGGFAVATANHASYLSTFTSFRLDLRGPSVSVQTACSTSLVAVHLACEALRNAECDMALAGATAIDVPHGWGYVHAEGGIMSPDGHCRAFDARSGGTLWGSGGGIVVLKRLSAAIADGDTVRAVILGNAINNDGADKLGFTAPSVSGQTAVIREALGLGGVDPRTVSYVEAHGTATALGDPIEVAALSSAFSTGTTDGPTQWCALGSVKTNIGHLSAASGVVGLIKTVLAFQHEKIPPSLHYETPHPKIDFATGPFYVNAALSPWTRPASGRRRAGVSSFGVGGTNAHLVLEEAPTTAPARNQPRTRLIRLSARSAGALGTAVERLHQHLEGHPELELGDVASTLEHGRRTHAHRGYLVARNLADAKAGLADPRRWRSGAAPRQPGRVAFLFSGQGSQYPGMGAGVYRAEPAYAAVIDECSEFLRGPLGLDLRDLLLADPDGADDRLTATALAQPALFTVEYALARWWAEHGVEPAAMLGHSIGEYVAATLAGVFSLSDALTLVTRRGALMQAAPPGAMLSLRLDEAVLRAELPAGLAVAAVNGPESCVVAGRVDDVSGYAATLAERGVAHARLRTSHAFHSPLMEPVLEEFRSAVAGVVRNRPERPLLSNLTGGWADPEAVTSPDYWVDHLRGTVRFGDNLAALLAQGDWTLLEVGPGGQLAALARQVAPVPPVASLPAAGHRGTDGGRESTGDDHATLLAAAGELWIRGAAQTAAGGHAPARRIPLPTYPYERRRYWVEPTTAEEPAPAPAPSGPRGIEEWFAVPTWRQLPPAPAPTSPEAATLIIGEGSDVELLAHRLRTPGSQGPEVVTPDEALRRLSPGSTLPGRIVYAAAWGAEPAAADPAAVRAAFDVGFYGVLSLAQALAAAQPEHPIHLDVVTTGTQAVVGDDVSSPEHATLAAAALVLPLELPWLTARLIDAPRRDSAVEAVAAEIRAPHDAPAVALRGGRRWIRGWEHVPVPAVRPGRFLQPGSVCLVTGGLGGIGITIAEQLAVRDGIRPVLLSRTPLPERAAWDAHLAVHGASDRIGRAIAAIRRIEGAGAEVLVLAADVTDPDDLASVRSAVFTAFGRLDAIVHAAGVAGGGMAEVKERGQAEAVLAPKVFGTLALSRAFGDLPLDAVVLCASVTGVAGGFGQVDYCAANAFLDAIAQAGTAFAGRVISVDWGSWLEVGMAAEVAAPSAFRALQRGVVTASIADPLLSTVHRAPGSDTAWCTGTIGPRTHWVLDEHRLDGRPVLPGTAHLSALVAAARAAYPAGIVELTDVTLTEPLTVDDDGQAELRVAFVEGTDDVDFQLSSRSSGHDQVHARGTVIRTSGPGQAPIHDLAAIRARCAQPAPRRMLTFSHSGLFRFGPRWNCLRQITVGGDEELARLEAPALVADELEQWPLHPALLDEALSFAAGRSEGHFLPLGYGRMVVRAPLTAQCWSHLRYRDTRNPKILVADVTIVDDEGRELVAITELVLRAVDPDAMRTATAAARLAPVAVSPGAAGIAPADGVEALRRLVEADLGPQLTVTVQPIDVTLAGARALTQRTLERDLTGSAADDRPERVLDSDYAPPTTELETALCGLWQEALGLDRVGIHDDFFATGGNSLVAVQLLGGIRTVTGQRVPMRALFDAPTVAGIAAEVDRLRAASPAEPPPAAPITALPRAGRTQ
ncbi:SDR family NAD(P)-dependent oxidoreductase [Cryptosporangium sp. NPDC051539]|uniref:type I polyketide synthase n=1 Tax=Cryptosporangium sp. NPDC051539 TaxID=3363962 RepID=UPI00379E1C46